MHITYKGGMLQTEEAYYMCKLRGRLYTIWRLGGILYIHTEEAYYIHMRNIYIYFFITYSGGLLHT